VAGAADALQAGRDRTGRADETAQLHRADVDPELEGRRRDDHLEIARLEQPLGAVAAVA
jgi:hypothetical protein